MVRKSGLIRVINGKDECGERRVVKPPQQLHSAVVRGSFKSRGQKFAQERRGVSIRKLSAGIDQATDSECPAKLELCDVCQLSSVTRRWC